MMVMTVLDLFPVLMPHEDENYSVTFLSMCFKGILSFITGAQRKMLAGSLLDIIRTRNEFGKSAEK